MMKQVKASALQNTTQISKRKWWEREERVGGKGGILIETKR
jgi:hypothetical protein